jgi:cysteine desulfurase
MKSIYLDHSATTPLDKDVYKKMECFISTHYANPSSLYEISTYTKKAINISRMKLSKVLNCNPKTLIFCSGGTEASNLAIKGYASKHRQKRKIITTQIEHHATLHTCEYMESFGYNVVYLNVNEYGFIDFKQLENELTDDTLMVSIIWANNEIGTIQDIKKIGHLCRSHGICFHVDAVQAFGQIEIDLEQLPIDMMTLSAHKFYGPRGAGCLYIKEGFEIDPLIHGGKHENYLRAGTENTAAIVGMAEASILAQDRLVEYQKKLSLLSSAFYEQLILKIPHARLNGPPVGKLRLPGHLSFSFPNLRGLDLALTLDKHHIYVSTGSACSADELVASHVLEAIKTPSSHIMGAIRITFGHENKVEEIPYVIEAIKTEIEELTEDY